MKKLIGPATLALALVLTGCGGGSDTADSGGSSSSDSKASYCDELNTAKDSFANLDVTKLTEDDYNNLVDELDKISASAPSDVEADWKSLSDALTQLHDLLASAGVSFSDLQDLSAGQLPSGVDAQKLQEIAPKVQKLSTDLSANGASQRISASAKKECGITLNSN